MRYYIIVLVRKDIQMQDETLRVLERQTQFFVKGSFKQLDRDIQTSNTKIIRERVTQLDLKCCGYGYFKRFKKDMLDNLLQYLMDALRYFPNIILLKIQINGFQIDNDQFHRLFDLILNAHKEKRLLNLKCLWIHTNNIKRCRLNDIKHLFQLISFCGLDLNLEQISIQVACWQFIDFIGYHQYFKQLQFFVQHILDDIKFKKFKLQLSSFYPTDYDAFRFLKQTITPQKLIERLIGNRFQRLNAADQNQVITAFQYYFNNLDQRVLKKDQKIYQQLMKKQAIIGQKLVKSLYQLITQMWVQQFHGKMVAFFGDLLDKMSEIQEFHIDMRGWSSMFRLGDLKSRLDVQVKSQQQFSMIRKKFGVMNRKNSKLQMIKKKSKLELAHLSSRLASVAFRDEEQKEQVPLKTTFMI